MEDFDNLVKVSKWVGLIPIAAYMLVIVILLVITAVYLVGYLYDSIMGNWGVTVGKWTANKIPQVRNNKIIKKFWKLIEPREMYLRYETPLCTYCFSYSAILILSTFVSSKYGFTKQYMIASCVYLIFYFVGMLRRCGYNSDYLNRVLKNNLDFLKLSFLPITFIITIFGFLFTVTGTKIQEFGFVANYFQNVFADITRFSDNTNYITMALHMLVVGLLLIALCYIVSLPIQLVAYFFIQVIQYFREHGKSYKELLKKYKNIWKYIFNDSFKWWF